MEIFISDFPQYESKPSGFTGMRIEEDSKVFDLEFDKDDLQYDVRALISITYERHYEKNTEVYLGVNYSDLISFTVEVIKGSMFKKEKEHQLGDKEIRRIEKYLKENIEIL